MSDINDALQRLLTNGAIDEKDAEEVRRFTAFLEDVAQYPREASKARTEVYFQHYPEERPPEKTAEEELL